MELETQDITLPDSAVQESIVPKGVRTPSFDAASKRYGFVVPRFFESLAGGAETLIGALAAHLGARGNPVEILTTCAADNRTWEDALPEGTSTEMGVTLRRFKVNPRNLDIWIPRQIQISEGMNIGLEDELLWMEHSVNSQGLYEYIARHAAEFDALFFGPYLFGTTFWGSQIAPERSYLIPCLHDEHYAYTQVMGAMFRQVAGAVFNAGPEADLARALYGKIRGGDVGVGFVPHTQTAIDALLPYFKEQFPYLLYVGRKETGKNVQVLIDYFVESKEKGEIPADLKLVIVGGGSFSDLHRPEALKRSDLVDLQHLSEEEKRRIIRHSTVLCQPSTNESFSIVIMEAWLLNRPVLVHASCAVTRYHALTSGGGLYFSNRADFAAVVAEMVSNRSLASDLGSAGRRYVERFYNWPAVVARFDALMEELLCG